MTRTALQRRLSTYARGVTLRVTLRDTGLASAVTPTRTDGRGKCCRVTRDVTRAQGGGPGERHVCHACHANCHAPGGAGSPRDRGRPIGPPCPGGPSPTACHVTGRRGYPAPRPEDAAAVWRTLRGASGM